MTSSIDVLEKPDPSREILPAIRPLLSAPVDERLKALGGKWYLPYSGAEKIIDKMEHLFLVGGDTGLIITGRSGCGKSTILERFELLHPRITSLAEAPNAIRIPVLRVETPEGPGPRLFLGSILQSFGFNDYARDSLEERWIRVLTLLRNKDFGIRIILVDELQNLLAGVHLEMQRTANLIKKLQNAVHVPIVFAGVSGEERQGLDAGLVFRWDPQLARRFPRFELPRWRDGAPYRRFLQRFEQTLPLSSPSRLDMDEKALYILKQCEGLTSDIIGGGKDAARLAITEGAPSIGIDHLRRATFTSRLRIGSSPSSNS